MCRWNQKRFEREYQRVIDDAKYRGFTDDELKKPYLTKLNHQTKSRRIFRMIELAYYLGQLRAVRDIDEGYTLIYPQVTEDAERLGEIETGTEGKENAD